MPDITTGSSSPSTSPSSPGEHGSALHPDAITGLKSDKEFDEGREGRIQARRARIELNRAVNANRAVGR
ncbi:hypothetical protein HMI55_005685 [Coelomomyces lativittatus]|nr:hypothetical protein HMI55_005685 [Coelomomyces lativittatus]